MSREDWRNKIAREIEGGIAASLIVNPDFKAAADAVLDLIEAEGRTLWWCPATQLGLTVNDCCHRSRHRRGVFIELDKP